MANELQTVLNQILAEKTEKITPENIKKGTTIYGVRGWLDIGMTTEEEFKALVTANRILGATFSEALHSVGVTGTSTELEELAGKFQDVIKLQGDLSNQVVIKVDSSTNETKTWQEILDTHPYIVGLAPYDYKAAEQDAPSIFLSNIKPGASVYTDPSTGNASGSINFNGTYDEHGQSNNDLDLLVLDSGNTLEYAAKVYEYEYEGEKPVMGYYYLFAPAVDSSGGNFSGTFPYVEKRTGSYNVSVKNKNAIYTNFEMNY